MTKKKQRRGTWLSLVFWIVASFVTLFPIY